MYKVWTNLSVDVHLFQIFTSIMYYELKRIEKSRERKKYKILIRVEIMRGYWVCLHILFDVLGLGTIFFLATTKIVSKSRFFSGSEITKFQ